MNSKQKGKRGELEAAKVLRDLGFDDVRRTVQYNGQAEEGQPDLCGIPGVHLEVKRTERIKLYDFWDQAVRDADEGETPVVMVRSNGKPWLMVTAVSDWARRERIYIKEWEE